MNREDAITIKQVAYHRNGIGGEGFFAVLFESKDNGLMCAAVFAEAGQVAVYSAPLLSTVGVKFGENSWRGDVYEPELREAIRAYEKSGKYAAGSLRAGPFSVPIE